MTKIQALLIAKRALRMYLIQEDSQMPNFNALIELQVDEIIATLTKESLKTSGLDPRETKVTNLFFVS